MSRITSCAPTQQGNIFLINEKLCILPHRDDYLDVYTLNGLIAVSEVE